MASLINLYSGYMLPAVCFLFHTEGSVKVLQGNYTWLTANKECISLGGKMAIDDNLQCSSISTQKIWLNGYKKVSWLKSLGCYNTSLYNKTLTTTIEKCIVQCNTKFIGFITSGHQYCYCFNTQPLVGKMPYSLCQSNNIASDRKVTEVFSISGGRMEDIFTCVAIRCPDGKTLNMSCKNKLKAFCDDHTFANEGGFDTLEKTESTCFAKGSFVKTDNVCSIFNTSVQFYWTGIRVYRSIEFANQNDIINTTNIAEYLYGECFNNGQTMTRYWGNCLIRLNEYACEFEDSTTRRLSSANYVPSSIDYTTKTDSKATLLSYTSSARLSHTTINSSEEEQETTSNPYLYLPTKVAVNNLTDKESHDKDTSNTEKSKGYNLGLAIGISLAVTTVVILSISIACYCRTRKGKVITDEIIDTKNNAGSKPQLHINSLYGYPDLGEGSRHHSNLGAKNLSTHVYGVVLKGKANVGTIYHDHEEVEETYDRLDHSMKKETETLSDNVYDSTLALRDVNDPTYNSARFFSLKCD